VDHYERAPAGHVGDFPALRKLPAGRALYYAGSALSQFINAWRYAGFERLVADPWSLARKDLQAVRQLDRPERAGERVVFVVKR